jgi:tetratricopeptide (TPR) repeat protein
MAMVHIARGHLDRAEPVLREGTIVQDRQANRKQRYPAKGLHWLLGLVRLASGDVDEAQQEFERELSSGTSQLYGREFAMNAHDGAGFALLRARQPALAVEAFNRALALFPDHARTLVGLGAALADAGDRAGADAAFARTSAAIDALRRGGRASEAMLSEAMCHTVQGRFEPALQCLIALLYRPDVPFSGWTIPIEPLLEPVRQLADFVRVSTRLADRAR